MIPGAIAHIVEPAIAEVVRAILPMSPVAVAKVRALEGLIRQREQKPITTHHLIHGGVYVRTIKLDPGDLITGVLIKRATTLILSGDATVATGDEAIRLAGYHVIAGSAHRKQAFAAHAETHLSMFFPTKATTVEEAEQEFTDEADMLLSRNGKNIVVITQEQRP